MELTAQPASVPGLPSALIDHAGYLSVVMGQRSQALFETSIEPLALRPVDYDYLAAVSAGGPIAQKDLARMLQMDAARIVGLTDELEQRELVQRTVDSNDRRRNLVSLTKSGAILYRRAGKVAARMEDDLLRTLTSQEKAELRSLLRKALGL